MHHAFPLQRLVLPVVLTLLVGACSTSKDSGASDSATASTPATDTAMAGMQHDTMGGMAMTGDPDRDFLRMMTDHHTAMSAMAHEAQERGGTEIKAIGRRIDTKQDGEIDEMKAMLAKGYKDSYDPKIGPDAQAMIDDLKSRSGKAYDKAFLEHTVMHHEMAIKMIDDYLARGKSASVKQMAQKMKADQTKEIAEFRAKAAKM